MVDVSYCPTGKPDVSLGLDMDVAGNFWRQGLNGPEIIGKIEPSGKYRFTNGQHGDYFESRNPAKEGLLDIELTDQPHAMNQALRRRERERALIGSEAPVLRARLNALGLTGQGVTIGLLDPYEPVEAFEDTAGAESQAWAVSEHSKATGLIVNHPVWGLAPKTNVIDLGFLPQSPVEGSDADDVSVFAANFQETARALFDETAQQIGQVLQKRTPDLRILSLTWGASLMSALENLESDLDLRKDNGDYLYPRTRQQVLGPALYQGKAAQQQAILNFMARLYREPLVQQARMRYMEATRQAAEQGLFIVTANGNEHALASEGVIAPPGSEMDELAKSPYVISVAASDTHQTPGYYQDDFIAPFSSRGDGFYNNPTIAAPGQNIFIPEPFETLSSNQVESGTSFAVPYVCGVLSLMLQANPQLTFTQGKAILERSALPLSGYNRADQGAGILQAENAVQLARQAGWRHTGFFPAGLPDAAPLVLRSPAPTGLAY